MGHRAGREQELPHDEHRLAQRMTDTLAHILPRGSQTQWASQLLGYIE
jgi:hypothetical protein